MHTKRVHSQGPLGALSGWITAYLVLLVWPLSLSAQPPAVRYEFRDTVEVLRIQGRETIRRRKIRIPVAVTPPAATPPAAAPLATPAPANASDAAPTTDDTSYFFRPQPSEQLLAPRLSDAADEAGTRTDSLPIPSFIQPAPNRKEAPLQRLAVRPDPKPEDIAELRKLAGQDNPAALLRLAEIFAIGNRNIVVRNADSAEYYLKRAVATGSIPAHHLLGVHYLMGFNGKRDIPRGLKLLNIAADSGYKPAFRRLVDQYAGIRGNIFLPSQEQMKPDSATAFAYALRGAKLGDYYCAFYTGRAYWKGQGVTRNDSLALQWMKYAARYLPEAQLLLGDWFFTGATRYGVRVNEAITFYDKARNNIKSNMDQQTAADIGIHYAGELARILQNAYRHLDFFLPENGLLVQYRP